MVVANISRAEYSERIRIAGRNNISDSHRVGLSLYGYDTNRLDESRSWTRIATSFAGRTLLGAAHVAAGAFIGGTIESDWLSDQFAFMGDLFSNASLPQIAGAFMGAIASIVVIGIERKITTGEFIPGLKVPHTLTLEIEDRVLSPIRNEIVTYNGEKWRLPCSWTDLFKEIIPQGLETRNKSFPWWGAGIAGGVTFLGTVLSLDKDLSDEIIAGTIFGIAGAGVGYSSFRIGNFLYRSFLWAKDTLYRIASFGRDYNSLINTTLGIDHPDERARFGRNLSRIKDINILRRIVDQLDFDSVKNWGVCDQALVTHPLIPRNELVSFLVHPDRSVREVALERVGKLYSYTTGRPDFYDFIAGTQITPKNLAELLCFEGYIPRNEKVVDKKSEPITVDDTEIGPGDFSIPCKRVIGYTDEISHQEHEEPEIIKILGILNQRDLQEGTTAFVNSTIAEIRKIDERLYRVLWKRRSASGFY